MGFPGGLDSKESACSVGNLGSIAGFGRSPERGHGNPLQYSCLENPHGQRILMGYSPGSGKELDMTEQLSTAQHIVLLTVVTMLYVGSPELNHLITESWCPLTNISPFPQRPSPRQPLIYQFQ